MSETIDIRTTVRERALLMTTYGGGLRVSEVVRLRVSDIDAGRDLLRVEQGKGRKDRYTLLGPRLLEAVEKPERGGDLSSGAHRGTFLPTHTHTVGRSYDEHDTVLSNGFDRGAMDIALGVTAGAEMATGQARPSAV